MSAKGDCPKRSRLPALKGHQMEKSRPLRGGGGGVPGCGFVCDVCLVLGAAHTGSGRVQGRVQGGAHPAGEG